MLLERGTNLFVVWTGLKADKNNFYIEVSLLLGLTLFFILKALLLLLFLNMFIRIIFIRISYRGTCCDFQSHLPQPPPQEFFETIKQSSVIVR